MYSGKATILAVAFLLTAPAYAAVAAETTAAAPGADAETQSFPAIRVVQAAERQLVDRIMVSGTFEAVEEVFVQPQVEALRIEELKADVGDVVKAGQVLATLSDDALVLEKSQLRANRAKALAVGAQMEAQLAEAQANEAEALRQAVRAEKLEKIDAVSTSQAEQLRATATAATARVKSARQAISANAADVDVIDAQIADIDLKLARTEVKSPVAGIVSERRARIGAIALGAGNPLFTVIRDNAIELKADVTEGDLLKLMPGEEVNMTVAGTSSQVKGKVRTVDPVIDATTRLGSVKIVVDNPEQVRIGMYASAEIIVSDRKVLSLPLTAITTESDGTYVRKVDDGRVKLTKVVAGVQDGDYVEIVNGLGAKDVVVEKAGAYVRDGDRVTPVFRDKTASN